jgi:alanine dehydrogenase
VLPKIWLARQSTANKGWKKALKDSPLLANGLNVWNGKLTCAPVADSLGLESFSPKEALE